jgi:cell division protein FtsQ
MSESKTKMIGALVLIGVTLFLVFGANAWKSNLRVKQIKIEGNRIVGMNEILQLTQIQNGSLLYQVDLTAIQHNVMSHYYIKDAIVERNLPNAIHIQIVERIPIAMLNGAEPRYVDDEGTVLPRTVVRKLFDLPMISGFTANEQLVLGSQLTQPDMREVLQLLFVLKAMNRPMYHNISEVQIRNGGDIILYSAEGGLPIIFGYGDLPTKLARLEVFWNDIVRSRGSQNLQYVDLRYQDQIVARWDHESSTPKKL